MLFGRRSRQAAKLVDPSRNAAKQSTRKVIERVDDWGHRLASAVERTERLAPILFPDEKPGRDA